MLGADLSAGTGDRPACPSTGFDLAEGTGAVDCGGVLASGGTGSLGVLLVVRSIVGIEEVFWGRVGRWVSCFST